ncbi:hypothetical protein ACFL35_08780 [Candidatus Riflebacteria bacterium]
MRVFSNLIFFNLVFFILACPLPFIDGVIPPIFAAEISDDLLNNEDLSEQVTLAVRNQNYLKAFKLLETAQWKKSDTEKLLLEQIKLLDKTQVELDAKLTLNPDDFLFQYLRAKIYFLQRKYILALNSIRKALSLKKHLQALNLKGWILFKIGRYRDSMAAFEEALLKNPSNEKIYRNFKAAYIRAHRAGNNISKESSGAEILYPLPVYHPSKKLLYVIDKEEKIPFRDVQGPDDLEEDLKKVDIVLYKEKKEKARTEKLKPKKPKPVFDENTLENQSDQGEHLKFEGEIFKQKLSATAQTDVKQTQVESKSEKFESKLKDFFNACDMQENDYKIFDSIDKFYKRLKELDPDFEELKAKSEEDAERAELIEQRYENARATNEIGKKLLLARKLFYSADEQRYSKVLKEVTEVLKFSSKQFWEGLYFIGICQYELGNKDRGIEALNRLKSLKQFKQVKKYSRRFTPEMRLSLFKTLVNASDEKGEYINSWENIAEMRTYFPDETIKLERYYYIKLFAIFEEYKIYLLALLTLIILLFIYIFIWPFFSYFIGRLFMRPIPRIRELMVAGDFPKALLKIENGLKNKRLDRDTHKIYSELLLECTYRVGHMEKAREHGEKLIKKYPDSDVITAYFARTLHQLRIQDKEAVDVYRKYLATDPNDTEILQFSIPHFLDAEPNDITIVLYEKFFNIDKSNTELNYTLAEHYVNVQNFNKDSLKVFKSVLEEDADDLKFNLAIFKCYEKLSMFAEIINEAKGIVKKYPEDLDLNLLLTSAYRAINMLEEAVIAYRGFAIEYPDTKLIKDILAGLELEFQNHQSKYLGEAVPGDSIKSESNAGILIDSDFKIPVLMEPAILQFDTYLIPDSILEEEEVLIEDPYFDASFAEEVFPAAEVTEPVEPFEEAATIIEPSEEASLQATEEEALCEEALLMQETGFVDEGDFMSGEDLPAVPFEDEQFFSSIEKEPGSSSQAGYDSERPEMVLDDDELFDLTVEHPNEEDIGFSPQSVIKDRPTRVEADLFQEKDEEDFLSGPVPGDDFDDMFAGVEAHSEDEKIITLPISSTSSLSGYAEIENLILGNQIQAAIAMIEAELPGAAKKGELEKLLLTCYVQEKEKEKAKDLYNELNWDADLLDLKSKNVLYDLAVLLEEAGSYKESLDIFSKILNADIGFKDSFDRFENLRDKVN